MDQENSMQIPPPPSPPNTAIPPPPPNSSNLPSQFTLSPKSSNEKSGTVGLSRSNPIRTIPTPTGVIGKGLAVAVTKSQIKSKKPSSESDSRQKSIAVENDQNVTIKAEKIVDPLASTTVSAQVPSTKIESAKMTKVQIPDVKESMNHREGTYQLPSPSSPTKNLSPQSLVQTIKSSNKSPSSGSNNRMKITQKIGSSIVKSLSNSNTNSKNASTTSISTASSVSSTQLNQPSQKSLPISQTPSTPKTFSLEEETDQFLAPFPLAPKPLESNNQALPTIQNLASRRAWGDVLHFTEEYLNGATFSYQPFYSQLKNCASSFGPTKSYHHINDDRILYRLQRETSALIAFRLQALLKLRRYSDLSREVKSLNLLSCQFIFPNETKEEIGNKVYHFTEDFKMQDRTDTPNLPTWVSYGLIILAAQSLQYTNEEQESIDKLHKMKQELEYQEATSTFPPCQEFAKKWKPRVQLALSNGFMKMQSWRMTLNILDDLLDNLQLAVEYDAKNIIIEVNIDAIDNRHEQDLNAQVENLSSSMIDSEDGVALCAILDAALRIEIVSRQIRIFLQMGAVYQAQSLQNSLMSNYQIFTTQMAHTFENNNIQNFLDNHTLIQQTSTQLQLNKGLLLFSTNEYDVAMDTLKETISMQRSKQQDNIPNTDFLATGITASIISDQHILTHSLNNLALCCLYTCDVENALELLEGLVKENPTLFLTEELAFNLCTLYELVADVTGSGNKKKILQSISKRFYLHDIATENFRIN